MTITVNDLKFFKSERMTDFADGGGQMTGNEIVSGVENQIFDDISDVDRAAGDVSIRKIYAAVTSANTDKYLDAGVVVFDEPDDPATSVLITSTGDFFDERAQIQSYIENYRIQSSRYFAWLFELQIEGARTITLFGRESDEAPSVNTTLLLIEYTDNTWATESTRQFVRIIRVLLDEVQEFTDDQGKFKRRIITVELSEALRYTFHGAQISRYDNLHPRAVVYTTMVVDAAKYYGIRPLVQQADPGDTVIYADSIRGRLIPSSQIESPVTDVTAAGERTFAVPASLTTINFTVSDTFIPGFVLYAGRPIYPGTLVISISGGELVDDGGNLKSGQTSVGEVDYAQGVITFSILSPTYAGTKTVTFRPGAAISRASNCYAIPITDQTRFRAYVASLKPLPDPGTLIVDYLSSGNWYRLRDNGNGALTGASAAYGSGTVNFTTGSVSLSLGSYPDINSAILFSWGSGADTRSLTQAAQALTFKVSTGRGGLVPGEQTLTWSGVSLTDQGDGTLTGTGGSGVIDYASGELTLTPATIPAANTALTFAGKQYAPASWYDESFTPTATAGVLSITLAHQNILPVSMTVYYTVQVADAIAPPTYPITSISTTATTATLTIGTHTFDVGSVIVVESLEAPLTYLNGTYTVTAKTATTVTFAATNAGYADTDTYSVSNVATTATTTTLTIGTHSLNVGNSIAVSGITAQLAYLNGTYTVTDKTATTVTFAATNAGYEDTDTCSVSNVATTATTTTLTVGTHSLNVGNSIAVSNITAPLAYLNGTHSITGKTDTTVTFAATNAGYEDTDTYVVSNVATTATTTTLTVGTHTLNVGNSIVVSGITAPLAYLNGTHTVTGETDTTVTFAASNDGYEDTDTYSVTNTATTATTTTLTIGTHTLNVGNSIAVSNITAPLAYLNGTHSITGKTDTTVTFAATNEGYPDTDTYVVSNVTTTATTTTLTVGTHSLNIGDSIAVSNITAPLAYLNGNHTVTAKTDTTVTFAATNAGYSHAPPQTEILIANSTPSSNSLTFQVETHLYLVGDQVTIAGFTSPYDFINGTYTINYVYNNPSANDIFEVAYNNPPGFTIQGDGATATVTPETRYYSGDYDGDVEVPEYTHYYSGDYAGDVDYSFTAYYSGDYDGSVEGPETTHYYSGDYDGDVDYSFTAYYSGDYGGDVDYSFTAYYSGDYGGTFSYPLNVMPLATRVKALGQSDNGWIRYERDNIDLSFTAGGAINPSAGTFTIETDCAFAWHTVPVYEYVPQQIQVWDEATNSWVIQVVVVQVLVRYDTVADVSGTFLPGSTVYVNYAVNNTPVAFSDGLTLATGGLRFSLQPVSGEQIAAGSVRLLLGDRVYQDVGSQMVYGWNSTAGAGTVAGSIDAASGQVILTDWASAANSYTIEARAIRIPRVPITTVTFRTPTAPIAVGSFSFRVNRYQSAEVFEGSADAYGVISGDNVMGKFDYQTGVATLSFGEELVASQHTSKPWYATEFITETGMIYAPILVDLETLRYNCVTYVSMPLDSSIIGIDPVRLPGDGLIPIIRPGQLALVHHTATHSENSLSPTQQVDMGRERLYRVVIDDANGVRFPASFYSVNRETGIVTMASDLNLTGYTAPYAFQHTVADLSVVQDTDLSGRLALTKAVSHVFPANTSRISGLLYIGTLQARYTNLFAQSTWTSEWSDERIGDAPLAQYNDVTYPIGVSNLGAYPDRFLFRLTGNTTFACYGEQLGYLGAGNINEDFAPINPLTNAAYFSIDYRGWGAGWSTGNCLRFNLVGANYPVDIIRSIQPSNPSGLSVDSVELLLVGNIDA